MKTKVTSAKRRRRLRKKPKTWVAGVASVVSVLAPHAAELLKVILKR